VPASRLVQSYQSRLFPPTRTFSSSIQWRQQATAEALDNADTTLTITEFQELAERELIHPNVVNTITGMGLTTMTDVQSATINQALRGTDM
jgi:ATP-dependent RNA helicase MSS116